MKARSAIVAALGAIPLAAPVNSASAAGFTLNLSATYRWHLVPDG